MLIAALGRLGRLDEARHVRKQFIAAAKVEMPNYPGEQLDNWMPIFGRMLSTTDPTVLLELRESLELCGWR
jgi:pentatricopeptide repeat protein